MAGTDPRIGAEERLQKLRTHRVTERKNAIANGLMSDPDVPIPLSEAISLVGTCDDMCPEYERVTRIAQKDVSGPEMDPATRGGNYRNQVPDEKRMVKKFRRPAAGIEEQIPSDLRTPPALTRTLDFLINDVIGNASSLESVHAFVWDRTRGVRNDYSVQQFQDLPRLKSWIRCLERICRFHFLSRHQVGGRFPHVAPNYDHHQDGEQGFKSLFSLLKCYEDAAAADSSYRAPNEPEFQAYKILTLIPKNDIEAVKRLIESMPEHVRAHPHLQHAYNIYVSASTALNSDKVSLPVAQKNIMAFWNIIESKETTYMLACTAEIFFQEIRKMALHTVLRTFGRSKSKAPMTSDWNLNDLKTPLGLDTEEEAREYAEAHEVAIKMGDNGTLRLERKGSEPLTLSRLQSFKSPAIQYFCGRLVESKREGRSFPDIINQPDVPGVTIEDDVEEESLFLPQNPSVQSGPPPGRRIAKARGVKRLNPSAQTFNLTDGSGDESAGESAKNPFAASRQPTQATPFQNSFASTQNNPFAAAKPTVEKAGQTAPSQNPFGSSVFGQPSTGFLASPFGKPPGGQAGQNANPFGTPSASSPFQSQQPTQNANPFGKPSAPSPFVSAQTASPFGQPSKPEAGNILQNQAPFGNPPPSYQFPSLGQQAPTSGVFSKAQPTPTSTASAPTFSFAGDAFTQTSTAGQPQQSVSFDFGAKQEASAASAPTNLGVQSAPSSFNFDFSFAGGSSSTPKGTSGFNNPFAGGQQSNTTSFDFAKPSQSEQQSLQKPSASAPIFQFSAGGANHAETQSQAPFSGATTVDAPKAGPAFAFTANSTSNTNATPTFATKAGSSTSADGTSPFNFAAGSSVQKPNEKSSTAQLQLPAFGTTSSETKTPPASTSGVTQPAQSAQTPAFKFGPSITQQKAEQEKQPSTTSTTAFVPEQAAVNEQPTAQAAGWAPVKEPQMSEVSMLPPVIIKKTPKRERPPVNEFGLTEKQQQRHDDSLDYIVRELFLLPNQGILDQYIDWKMWPVFEEARKDRERILQEERFTNIRKTMLLRKYCSIWKAKASILRHRRQGRERRERLEKIRLEKLARLEEEKRRSLYAANAQHIMAQAEESLRRSQAERARQQQYAETEQVVPPASSLAVQTPSKRDLRQSILRRTPASEPSKKSFNDKRVHFSTSSKASNTKQPEKPSPADHIYTPPRPLSGDPLRQSANDPLPAKLSTVRSDYFRLKAMGLQHLSPAYYKNTHRWRERENTGSTSVLSIPSTSASSQRTSASSPLLPGHSGLDTPEEYSSARKSVRFDESNFGSSILHNGLAGNDTDDSVNAATSSVKRFRFSDGDNLPSLQRNPDASAAGKRKYTSSFLDAENSIPQDVFTAAMDEDERRIARIKALTSRMARQTDIFRDPDTDHMSIPPLSASLGENYNYNKKKEEPPNKKVKLSLSSNDEGEISLEDARRQLPAYWFRDSKFVPRSEYGLGPRSNRTSTGSSTPISGLPSQTSQNRATIQASNSGFPSGFASSNQQRMNGVSGPPAPPANDDIIVIDSSDESDNGQNHYQNDMRAHGGNVKQEILDEEEEEDEDEEEDDDDENQEGEEDENYDEEEDYEEDEDDIEEVDEDGAGGTFDDPIVL